MSKKDEIKLQVESYILRLITKREYSTHMIREKCHKKFLENQKSPLETSAFGRDLEGVTDQIEKIIKTFEENKYISDQRFTESLIRDQIRQKQGPLKISQKLYQYGVEKNLSEKLLEENYPPKIRAKVATEIFHKKKSEWVKKKKSELESTQKSINYVQSRGFNYYDIDQDGQK